LVGEHFERDLFDLLLVRFRAPASVDVDVHPRPLLDTSLRIEHGSGADVGPTPPAVRRTNPELDIHQRPCCDRVSPLPLGIGAVVGMDRVEPAIAQPLIQALAGVGAPAWAVGDDHAVGIGLPHRLREALDQKAVPRLALAQPSLDLGPRDQFMLGRDPARDVEVGEELVDRSPLLVLERAQKQRGDEARPVLAVLDRLDHLVAVLLQRLAEPNRVLLVRFLPVHEEGLLAQHLVHAVARKVEKGRVREDDGIPG
jgi:hypothetical protein